MPNHFYKYRRFDNLFIETLIDDMVYLADPSFFNDPLDSKPSLEVDVDEEKLAGILRALIEQRIRNEMKASFKTANVLTPSIQNNLDDRSRKRADEYLKRIGYFSTDPDGVGLKDLLSHSIEHELLKRYACGIFCLCKRATCPLMWSHYGDQHRGICVGYSLTTDIKVHQVKYGGKRSIKASTVGSMLAGSDTALNQVNEASFLRKAPRWSYEQEWRLIGTRGLQNSPFELNEIVFGARCSRTVKYLVIKALESREHPVNFYEIRETHGSFTLKKQRFDYSEELLASLPRRSLDMYDDFEEFHE